MHKGARRQASLLGKCFYYALHGKISLENSMAKTLQYLKHTITNFEIYGLI